MTLLDIEGWGGWSSDLTFPRESYDKGRKDQCAGSACNPYEGLETAKRGL